MITVTVSKQSNYSISTAKIKNVLREFLFNKGIVSDAQVSVSIVGEKSMLELGKKYLKDRKLHNVLSFTEDEVKKKFAYPPGSIYLGEIILCYPKICDEANVENKLIEEKFIELVEHGAMHLLGIHHE